MKINWQAEVEKRKDELLLRTKELLQIPSVLNEEGAKPGAPFGPEVAKALQYTLDLCEQYGMKTKDLEGYIGYAEFGEGQESVGILCHVDVVPAGDGWSVPPFSGEIRDGKIISRGAIDDKGPTMAAILAAKIVKDLGIPLNRRIRLIFGADEESHWRCVDKYFAEEEMPTLGFAPDADFPLIYAEKGLYGFQVQLEQNRSQEGPVQLKKFTAGHRSNMVPDLAEVVLRFNKEDELNAAKEGFLAYLQEGNFSGKAEVKRDELLLSIVGLSAHGATPDKGIHAGWLMTRYLHHLSLDEQGAGFIQLLMDQFVEDYFGERIGVAISHDQLGPLTINVGVIQYPSTEESKWNLAVSLRYPIGTEEETIRHKLMEKVKPYGYSINGGNGLKPHYVAKDHPLVQTLMRVYQEQTGDYSEPLAIGGATYARSLKAGVAFGAAFPGREDVAHQKDEYILIDDLMKATAIYAQGIYELANVK